MEQRYHNIFSKKKLLIITPSYPNDSNSYIGGIFVKNQVNILKLYFNEIIIISPVLFSFKMLSKDKLCQNYNYDNVKVYYPRSFYIPILYFKKILIDNRLKVIENLIKKQNINFDLIHAHFTWPSTYIGIKLKEKYNAQVVATLHANSTRFYKEIDMNYPKLNFSWKNADALIRVNKKDIPILHKFNDNVFFVPNGFSPEFAPLNTFECRSKLDIPTDKKIIFSLGGLIERKGFEYLIDSMKLLTYERNDFLCFIGGTGPLKDKLQKQVNKLNLTNKVILIGFVPDELLSIWMNACDVFVLPSLSESFGIVVIEAMACGKPVIATYNGGSEEIITSDNHGYLVDSKNSQKLYEKIALSLEKAWDKNKIKEYAKHFELESTINQTLEIYKSIIK